MKNLFLALTCLLVGGAAGYGLRYGSEGGEKTRAALPAAKDREAAGARKSAVSQSAGEDFKNARAKSSEPPREKSTLADRVKEILVDYDPKSARKAAAKLSLTELKDALVLTASL